jgi:chaperonin GroEL
MLEGATILANAVKATMGPSGHNVIIDREMSAPFITKDGVTVARSINLKKKLPSIGAELLKEVASKTNEQAGDGTTTATVLGFALLSEGVKMITTGHSSIEMKRGMELASVKIVDWLKDNCIKVRGTEDIINVGTISANGDRQIGQLLSDAIDKVGEDGIITIEPAKSFRTSLEVVEGMQFDGGYISPYFITNQEKNTVEFQDPFVLITNRKISSLSEILPLLEQVANEDKPLIIIGDEIEGEALQTLIVNKMRGVLHVCAVKAPSYGDNRTDILSDISLVTGGTVIDSSSPQALKNVQVSDLGTCKKVIITRTSTTIVGNTSDEMKAAVDTRVQQLRSALATDTTMDGLRINNYKKRLAKLAGGIAVVKVGGSTEVEILEKKDRVEDALNATVAAVQEGIIPGGGTALFYAACELESSDCFKHLSQAELAGVKVVINACKAPLRTIVENTGKSADVVMNKLVEIPPNSYGLSSGDNWPTEEEIKAALQKKIRFGYDASKHRYGDLIEWGIIDPVKVPRYALEHATSVVGLMLTCNAVVVNETEEAL